MVSTKISPYKAATLLLLLGALLILLVFIAAPPNTPFANYTIESSEDAAAFLSDLGWEIDLNNISAQQSALPEQFDNVFLEYNTLQQKQNCDLTKYAGKEITIYSVPIVNYSDTTEKIYATILVHNKKIIGGDIHSANIDGFMHTLL